MRTGASAGQLGEGGPVGLELPGGAGIGAEGVDDGDHCVDGGDRFEAAQLSSLHGVSFPLFGCVRSVLTL